MSYKPEKGLPEVGDIVEYTYRGVITLPVTRFENDGGFTSYWLGDVFIGNPLFNINWTTLNANRGSWRIVKKPAAKPREFKVPDAPSDLTRVQAMDGTDEVFIRDGERWKDSSGYRYCWDDLIREYEGVIELVETPYEAAVAFFKNRSLPLQDGSPIDVFAHARVIIDKAIEEA